jgi:site-specific DNA recombinase
MQDDLKGKRIATYGRYSTDKQNPESTADQLDRIRRYVEGRGGRLEPTLIFSDEAVSGAIRNRPGLNSLMAACEERRVDVVAVEDLGRLSRHSEDGPWIRNRLSFYGIRLIALNDGIDTAREGAELHAGMVQLVKEQYLRDVAKQTRRGMESRARDGKAFGKLPIGYRSVPSSDGRTKEIGIDPERAEIVRRIFQWRVEGKSFPTIATLLNRECVPPPHGNGRRKVDGWVSSAVRAILRNERYVGRWAFGETKWRRDPDTRKRLPLKRTDESEIVRLVREDLRIIDPGTWEAVASQWAQPRPSDGKRLNHGRTPTHLLSGILECCECRGPMIVSGGTAGRRYYQCAAAKQRGTCANRGNIAEGTARAAILKELIEAIATPAALSEIRRLYAAHVAGETRTATSATRQRRSKLADLERKIEGLIMLQVEGDRSEYVSQTRKRLEAEATEIRSALAADEAQATAPVRLPSLADVERAMLDVAALLSDGSDVSAAREAIRRLTAGRRIRVEPDGAGTYRAYVDVYPLAAILSPETAAPSTAVSREGAWSSGDCGGRQYPMAYRELIAIQRIAEFSGSLRDLH